MGVAILSVGGRRYEIACRDGEEARLEALGRVIDGKAQAAAAGTGHLTEARQLLFAALLLADELGEARAAPPGPAAVAPAPDSAPPRDPELVSLLDALGEHLEALAGRLEKAPGDA